MKIAFIDRPPTPEETERWRLIMSTFVDGSGQERDSQGNTRLGWRDIERVAAVLLGGDGAENKQLFDVVVRSPSEHNIHYGLSIKSKELSRKGAIGDLALDGRVYMELCNSPAKLWNPLKAAGYTEEDFSKQKYAEKIGPIVLKTVSSWHKEFAVNFAKDHPGRKISLEKSVYLTVSYNSEEYVANREYQIHSFPLEFPKGIIWKYNSARCLRGFDPAAPSEVLFDWYALSGGQLKYYPRASSAKFQSERFRLSVPRMLTLEEKASRYFPEQWIQANGAVSITPALLADELLVYAKLLNGEDAAFILRKAAGELKKL